MPHVMTDGSRPEPASAPSGREIHRLLGSLVILGTAFLTPINFTRLGLSSDSGVDIGKWVVLAPFWLAPIVIVAFSRSLASRLVAPGIRYVVAWAAWMVVSAAWSNQPVTGALAAVSSLSMVAFTIWFVDRFGWELFVGLTALGLAVSLAAGLVWSVVVGADSTSATRFAGLASTATEQGVTASVAVVLGMIVWKRFRRVAFAAVALGVVSMLLADSRAAMMATVAAGLVLLSRRLRFAQMGALIGVAGLIAVLFLTLTAGNRNDRYSTTEELVTLTGRTEVWGVTIARIADRPIVGHGAGSSEGLFSQTVADGDMWWPAYGAHNVALATLLEGGLVAGVLFAGAILSVVGRVRGRPELIALLVALGVNGITEGLVERPRVTLLALAAVTAAATPAARGAMRDVRQLSELRPSRRIIGALGAAMVVAVFVALLVRSFGGGPDARARLQVNGSAATYLVAADRARLALSTLSLSSDVRVNIDVPVGQRVVDVVVSGTDRDEATRVAADVAQRLADLDRARLELPLVQRENGLADELVGANAALDRAVESPGTQEQDIDAAETRVSELKARASATALKRRTLVADIEYVGLVAANGGRIPNEVLAGGGAGYVALLVAMVIGQTRRSNTSNRRPRRGAASLAH
jgi:O-antigen ligase